MSVLCKRGASEHWCNVGLPFSAEGPSPGARHKDPDKKNYAKPFRQIAGAAKPTPGETTLWHHITPAPEAHPHSAQCSGKFETANAA